MINGIRTVESCHSIDVRQWQRKGRLVEGGFQWWLTDAWSLMVTVESDCLTLAYHWQTEAVRYLVPLIATPCNYGGQRYWFVCPAQGCSRRAAILYLAGGRFAWRYCHRLAYHTQHENAYGRGLLKAQRIREKLGGSGDMTLPFPPKPKGMRWRTYYRLKDADRGGEMRWITGVQAWLDSRKCV
jgi:hypothetical protein